MGMMINRRRAYGEGSNSFIKFADPTMKSLCVGLWGGADGGTAPLNTRVNNTKVLGVDGELTYEQAASIKSIDHGQFNKNTTIISFDELQYFTELLSIGQSAFLDCSSLTSIDIPSGVTNIGGYAFCRCSNLTSVTIPNSVTSISVGAFSWCLGLTSVTIPSGVTSISNDTFAACINLTSVTIHSRVTNIGGYAFQGCSSLRSIEIPDSITSIGGMAFQKCSSLTNITIGSGVTYISVQVFSDCTRLNSITIQATTPPILSHENSFANTNNCPIYVPSGSVEAYKNANVWSNLSSRIFAIPTN